MKKKLDWPKIILLVVIGITVVGWIFFKKKIKKMAVVSAT